jgi:hypothetical protein
MVNNHHTSQKTNGTGQNPDIEEAVRQTVEGAVRAAVPPSIRAQQVVLRVYITVNLKCCDHVSPQPE